MRSLRVLVAATVVLLVPLGLTSCATPSGYIQGSVTGTGGGEMSLAASLRGQPLPDFTVQLVQGKHVVATFTTDASGKFGGSVAPGTYRLQGCGPVVVTVEPNAVASASVRCTRF